MSKVINITEQVFGKLTVLKREGSDKEGKALWLCKCDCGNEALITGKRLRKGTTKSCGCIVSKHNMTDTTTWKSWRSMMRRCYETTNQHYERYGARGIRVSEKWHEFVNFLTDMGERPDGTSLDRINNDGNYEADNCRWADNFTQNNNRGDYNTKPTLGDLTLNINEWGRKLNIKPTAITERLRRGWSIEKTLTTPCKSYTKETKLWKYKGETKNLSQWAKTLDLDYVALHARIRMSWEFTKAVETPFRNLKKAS